MLRAALRGGRARLRHDLQDGVLLVRPVQGPQRIVDELGALAELGFDAAIGAVAGVWDVAPLEVIGAEVIPVVADF